MCLAVPMKIISVDGDLGTVDIGGTRRKIGLTLIDEPMVGDYVLVHAGFAIQKIDEEEANKTMELLRELAEHMEVEDRKQES